MRTNLKKVLLKMSNITFAASLTVFFVIVTSVILGIIGFIFFDFPATHPSLERTVWVLPSVLAMYIFYRIMCRCNSLS